MADCQAFLNVSKALAKSLLKVNKIPVGLGAPGARFAFTFGGFTEGFPVDDISIKSLLQSTVELRTYQVKQAFQ